jgi:nucleotide-binding universal stress UspA family protein
VTTRLSSRREGRSRGGQVASNRHRESRGDGSRRIAVVVDDSEASRLALQNAVAAARRRHAWLTIISVVPRAWSTVATMGVSPQRLEAEATEYVVSTVRGLAATAAADVPCTTIVRRGRATKEILGVLSEHQYELVFLAISPGGGLAGSVGRRGAVRLMRKAPTDIVLLSFPRRRKHA